MRKCKNTNSVLVPPTPLSPWRASLVGPQPGVLRSLINNPSVSLPTHRGFEFAPPFVAIHEMDLQSWQAARGTSGKSRAREANHWVQAETHSSGSALCPTSPRSACGGIENKRVPKKDAEHNHIDQFVHGLQPLKALPPSDPPIYKLPVPSHQIKKVLEYLYPSQFGHSSPGELLILHHHTGPISQAQQNTF